MQCPLTGPHPGSANRPYARHPASAFSYAKPNLGKHSRHARARSVTTRLRLAANSCTRIRPRPRTAAGMQCESCKATADTTAYHIDVMLAVVARRLRPCVPVRRPSPWFRLFSSGGSDDGKVKEVAEMVRMERQLLDDELTKQFGGHTDESATEVTCREVATAVVYPSDSRTLIGPWR